MTIIDEILVKEGWPKFTDDSTDRGGPTKGGLTLDTLESYLGRKASIEELKDLPEELAREIYNDMYIVKPGFIHIKDELLREQVVDAGVLHGTARVSRWLQEIVNTKTDGKFGCVSQAFVNEGDTKKIYIAFAVRRIQFICDIIKADSTQLKFLRGWINRATSFLLKL